MLQFQYFDFSIKLFTFSPKSNQIKFIYGFFSHACLLKNIIVNERRSWLWFLLSCKEEFCTKNWKFNTELRPLPIKNHFIISYPDLRLLPTIDPLLLLTPYSGVGESKPKTDTKVSYSPQSFKNSIFFVRFFSFIFILWKTLDAFHFLGIHYLSLPDK